MGWFDSILKGVPLIGALSDILGGASAASAQRQANATNLQINKENREWTERMSNTSWQRGTQDMLAAGLNPMLAFSQGGASTPSNSAATVQPVDALGRGISSAGGKLMQSIAASQGVANIQLTKAQTEKAQAEADTARVTSANAEGRQSLEMKEIQYRVGQLIEQQDLTAAQRIQIEQMLPILVAQAKKQLGLIEQQTSSARVKQQLDEAQLPSAQAEAEVWEKLGAAGRGANIGANALQQIIAIIRSVLR